MSSDQHLYSLVFSVSPLTSAQSRARSQNRLNSERAECLGLAIFSVSPTFLIRWFWCSISMLLMAHKIIMGVLQIYYEHFK